jgi:hypothetical protein
MDQVHDAGTRRACTTGRRSSSAMTREDEEDEERSVVSSLELERQWRGSTAAVKSQ